MKSIRILTSARHDLVRGYRFYQLQIANRLDDLRIPPGNRLERLKGDRVGQHSIRINDQYRLSHAGAEEVEIVDCH